MEIQLDGVLEDRAGEALRLTLSLHRSPDRELPRVDTQLLLRGRTLSLSVATYSEELRRAAVELPSLLDGQLDSARILEYDHAFWLLQFDSQPDVPDLVRVTGESHLPSPEGDPWGRIDGFPVRGRPLAGWFCVAFGPFPIPRSQLRGLAGMIARFMDPENPSPVAVSGHGYRYARPDGAVLLPPPGARRGQCPGPRRPRKGSGLQVLPIIEEALVAARATPPRPRHGLLAAVALVLARLDPERAYALLTEEANLTAPARARAVEDIAGEATGVPFARVQEWLERAGLHDQAVRRSVRALAGRGSARALEIAREAADLAQRTELCSLVADLAPEPLRQEARSKLLQTVREVAADGPRFRGRSAGWVVWWLAGIDPPAALALLRGLEPSEQRAEPFGYAAYEAAKRAPHLLPELLGLAEANPTQWRDDELAGLAEAHATADSRRALALARKIIDGETRVRIQAKLLPALFLVDSAQAWEVVVEAATLASESADVGPWRFERDLLPAVAEHLPQRAEELFPLLARGELKEARVQDRFLLLLAERDYALAARLLHQRPAEEWWSGAIAVLQGASRADPQGVVESVLALRESGRQWVAEQVVTALAEVDARWALELATRTGDARVAIRGAVHARWYSFHNPAAAAELAEVALQTMPPVEAGGSRWTCSPRDCCCEESPDETRGHLAVLLALADPARAMEVARTLTDPETKVRTMLDIAERAMGVESRYWAER